LPGKGPEHDFAVHQVLGTAETDEPYFRRLFIGHYFVIDVRTGLRSADRRRRLPARSFDDAF